MSHWTHVPRSVRPVLTPFLWCGVLTVLVAAPSAAETIYARCLSSADPEQCIAQVAVRDSRLSASMALDAVMMGGLTTEVALQSDRLLLGFYEHVGEPDYRADTPEEKLLDSNTAATLRRAPRASILAAIALVAAARLQSEPFDDPVYIRLAEKAGNDPQISALALGIWTEFIGIVGWPPGAEVKFAGLAPVWDRAVARKEQDGVLLQDIAGGLAAADMLTPQARDFLLWYSRQPHLTPYQRVEVAWQFAYWPGLWKDADRLLRGIDTVDDLNVAGLRRAIAIGRLREGYHSESAQLLAAGLLEKLEELDGELSLEQDRHDLDALERSGAHDQLRMLATECMRRAKDTETQYGAAAWYASASEFYLRAGDRMRAQEAARLGLRYVPELVRQVAAVFSIPEVDDPAAMAIAVQGLGTAPVVALYRSGAVPEALATRYLTGNKRYYSAERAGEQRDPQWVMDYGWDLDVEVVSIEASHSTDRQFQQRVYDGLVRRCGAGLAGCRPDRLQLIAVVAAGMADEQRMRDALAAAVRQFDGGADDASSAVYLAGIWAHCEFLLDESTRRAASSGKEAARSPDQAGHQ